jgi:hypothetical protein
MITMARVNDARTNAFGVRDIDSSPHDVDAEGHALVRALSHAHLLCVNEIRREKIFTRDMPLMGYAYG